MTGTNVPGQPGQDPAFQPDAEVEKKPRRARQPALAVLVSSLLLALLLVTLQQRQPPCGPA